MSAGDPASPAVTELASLFELYRLHYGQAPAPGATQAWVGEMARSRALTFHAAYHGPRMVGFAAVHQIPASLRLGRFWQLCNHFTDLAMRRRGIARQLVETVREAATDAGAPRLPLQTEPTNAAALELYRRCGFAINAELTMLSLDLARQGSACETSRPGQSRRKEAPTRRR